MMLYKYAPSAQCRKQGLRPLPGARFDLVRSATVLYYGCKPPLRCQTCACPRGIRSGRWPSPSWRQRPNGRASLRLFDHILPSLHIYIDSLLLGWSAEGGTLLVQQLAVLHATASSGRLCVRKRRRARSAAAQHQQRQRPDGRRYDERILQGRILIRRCAALSRLATICPSRLAQSVSAAFRHRKPNRPRSVPSEAYPGSRYPW